MKTRVQLTAYVRQLRAQIAAHVALLGYEVDDPSGLALTKYDCGMVIASIGKFLGYKVYGMSQYAAKKYESEWSWREHMDLYLKKREKAGMGHCDVLNLDQLIDGEEVVKPYKKAGKKSDTCGKVDYTWMRGDRCVAIFETDGRDNTYDGNMCGDNIKEDAAGTLNLLKLSPRSDYAGFSPRIRSWILFQVDNKRKNGKDFTLKGKWAKRRYACREETITEWRRRFAACADLKGVTVFADNQMFDDDFINMVFDVYENIEAAS